MSIWSNVTQNKIYAREVRSLSHEVVLARYTDPISRFAIIHFPDRQTDRRDRRQLCTKSAYAHALWIVITKMSVKVI